MATVSGLKNRTVELRTWNWNKRANLESVAPLASRSQNDGLCSQVTTYAIVQFHPQADYPFRSIIWAPVVSGNLLPAEEGIGLAVDDIPDIRTVARARIGNRNDVPTCTCESSDVLHFGGGLACPPI